MATGRVLARLRTADKNAFDKKEKRVLGSLLQNEDVRSALHLHEQGEQDNCIEILKETIRKILQGGQPATSSADDGITGSPSNGTLEAGPILDMVARARQKKLKRRQLEKLKGLGSKKQKSDGGTSQTAPPAGEVVSLDSPSSPGSRGSSLYSPGHSGDENHAKQNEGTAATSTVATAATSGDDNPCTTDDHENFVDKAQSAKHLIVTVDITFQKKKREAKHRAETTIAWMLGHYEKKILMSKWASSGGITALQVCDEDGLPLNGDVTLGELRDKANCDGGSGSQAGKANPVKLVFKPC